MASRPSLARIKGMLYRSLKLLSLCQVLNTTLENVLLLATCRYPLLNTKTEDLNSYSSVKMKSIQELHTKPINCIIYQESDLQNKMAAKLQTKYSFFTNFKIDYNITIFLSQQRIMSLNFLQKN